MRRKKARRSQDLVDQEQRCALCRLCDDDPALLGEKVTLKDHNLCVHYFCLLTSCGVYQRGKEDEGVFGFLVDDIKQEVRRSARLVCSGCKKKGACVGCSVRRCRRTVHFPCGRRRDFLSQFTGLFPSFCPDHSPTQTALGGPDLSPPRSCSVCLDPLDPVLSFSVLKCPSCHSSWFHRDCVQRQAHSAGLFFFRCTLCSNQKDFQEEMLRMGIYIPERDASWELEANAYSELLEVYTRCDALVCLCSDGRTHSAKTGWFQVIRCQLCGSRGTHRKCWGLKLDARDWACSDCTEDAEETASTVTSPQGGQRSLLSKLHSSPISCKRAALPVGAGPPEGILQSLGLQLCPLSMWVEVDGDQALSAGVELVRRADFDPTRTLSVCFKDPQMTPLPSSLQDGDAARQYFLELLVQQIQDSVVFEGPDGSKNLALDSQALRDDLYLDVGCLLALSLAHGGPPVGFFSPALYRCLFNYPPGPPLGLTHMTPGTLCTRRVGRIAEAESVEELREAALGSRELLELAGCSRPIGSLEEKEALVEDLVRFTMVTRMQLPLQRFREGLQTLGVFDQVTLRHGNPLLCKPPFTHNALVQTPLQSKRARFPHQESDCMRLHCLKLLHLIQVQRLPSVFHSVFCEAEVHLSAQTLHQLFSIHFSPQEDRRSRETPVSSFWRRFLQDCEVGRSSISLKDLLRFATGTEELPAAGGLPSPSISFLHRRGGGGEERRLRRRECLKDEGLLPERELGSKRLLLPVTSSYQAFKSCMERAIS